MIQSTVLVFAQLTDKNDQVIPLITNWAIKIYLVIMKAEFNVNIIF